jgi:hypothetical protein
LGIGTNCSLAKGAKWGKMTLNEIKPQKAKSLSTLRLTGFKQNSINNWRRGWDSNPRYSVTRTTI